MITSRDHLAKARTCLVEGRYLLAGGFAGGAGRDAYMAAFHIALAYIVQRTGKEPKTHHGTRAEFSRLAHTDKQMNPAFAVFLGRSYELKASADYDDCEPMTADDAAASLREAETMVNGIAQLLGE